MVHQKTPYGYTRDKNGRLRKKPSSTIKRRTTKKKKGGAIPVAVGMMAAKILGPPIIRAVIKEVRKGQRRKRGSGLRLMGTR